MFKERGLFKEKYINDNNEHFILLKKLYENILDKEMNEILDCGTGKQVYHHFLIILNKQK